MSNTDRDSMLERWADGMEKLEKHYEDLYGPPSTPATLPDVTDHSGMLAAIADELERARLNINKHSTVYRDTKSAYAKTVPANTKKASIEKLGGKTVVWNQLATASMYRPDGFTYHGFTLSHIEDGFTINGTTTASDNIWLFIFDSAIIGHKYLIKGTPVYDGVFLRYNNGGGYISVSENFFVTPTNSSNIYVAISFVVNTEINLTWSPQIYDLTLMFGLGNEPSTVAEFEFMFPADYYAYNAGTLLSAGVTEVVSKDTNNTTLQTYSVPAEVQVIDGYGLSSGAAFNCIDFENKKFIQKVKQVDLSTLSFGYGPTVGWSATLSNVKNPADDDTAFNGLSATLTVTDRATQAAAFDGGTDAGMVSVAGGKVYVGTGDISIVPSGKLIYELDTPVETDISAYVADDTRIEVEPGGTLTFPNNNGDDYKIPVPSTETFWVDIS